MKRDPRRNAIGIGLFLCVERGEKKTSSVIARDEKERSNFMIFIEERSTKQTFVRLTFPFPSFFVTVTSFFEYIYIYTRIET